VPPVSTQIHIQPFYEPPYFVNKNFQKDVTFEENKLFQQKKD